MRKHQIRSATIKGAKIRRDLGERLQEPVENTDSSLNKLKNTVDIVIKEHLKPDNNTKQKSWMTDEILHMMEQRRLLKHENEYHKVQKKIKEANERELKEDCKEIDILQHKYDNFNVYKKIKETTRNLKNRTASRIRNKQGNIIVDRNVLIEIRPPITIEKIRSDINQMKEGNAPGSDQFHSEFLKLLDYSPIRWIGTIFSDIYQTGNIAQEWLQSEFIPIPKEIGANNCDQYMIISLMCNLLKLFLKMFIEEYTPFARHLCRKLNLDSETQWGRVSPCLVCKCCSKNVGISIATYMLASLFITRRLTRSAIIK